MTPRRSLLIRGNGDRIGRIKSGDEGDISHRRLGRAVGECMRQVARDADDAAGFDLQHAAAQRRPQFDAPFEFDSARPESFSFRDRTLCGMGSHDVHSVSGDFATGDDRHGADFFYVDGHGLNRPDFFWEQGRPQFPKAGGWFSCHRYHYG